MLQRFYRLESPKGPELCFYADCSRPLNADESSKLAWFIGQDLPVSDRSQFSQNEICEIGPRINITTSDSTNAASIFKATGIPIRRIEESRRFLLRDNSPEAVRARHFNRMTHTIYDHPLVSFDSGLVPEPVYSIPVLARGIDALREANKKYDLGIGDDFLEYYLKLAEKMRRDFTNVEFVQLGNNNSNHSRHLDFNALIDIDDQEMPGSLMSVVKRPWIMNPNNSLVAFHDNAGVIRGRHVLEFLPQMPGQPSPFQIVRMLLHIFATAETHNHPTLISPFEGATTGPGGRIRDGDALGRGTHSHAGSVGYFGGNLHLSGYAIPGEVVGGDVNPRFADPLSILINGSNGACAYHNRYGEPLITGFRRNFGQIVDGTRFEARKSVLFTGGVGFVDDRHTFKHEAKPGMLIIGLGGPAYPIGFGGGAASSGADNSAESDLKSVQRGDAQMENRASRVLRACVELGDNNPIELIHDQGAGGPSNVLTELVEKVGGRIDLRKIVRGDNTMSDLYVWVCEYQERYGLVVRAENLHILQMLCHRENVNCEVLGEVTGDGRIVVHSEEDRKPVDLSLDDILGEIPRKRFKWKRVKRNLLPLVIPKDLTCETALKITFAQTSVGSKQDVVDKGDRSVTGLVGQQQSVGPTQIPVANVGVKAASYFDVFGVAMALGEQPIVGLIDAKAGARMAITEGVTNVRAALVTGLEHVTFRGNWMAALKIPGEGPRLWDAANAMADFMVELGVHINGGKDSGSMLTDVSGVTAVTPLQLVAKAFGPIADVNKVCNPDFKRSRSKIGYLDLGYGKMRMGGSALAQALNQLGNECPDIEAKVLKEAFNAIGTLMEKGVLLSYHDVSDGGLITTIAEMCLAGNRGALITVPDADPIRYLFNQEAGMVFEYREQDERLIKKVLRPFGRHFSRIGTTRAKRTSIHDRTLRVVSGRKVLIDHSLPVLRSLWEATRLRLEEEQTNIAMVEQERRSHQSDCEIPYRLTFTPRPTAPSIVYRRPKVAVIRDEGTNGDREMSAAVEVAGGTPIDIVTQDLLDRKITSLKEYQGAILCGGFSRADVFGSARGWAGITRFNPGLDEMFSDFYGRDDIFSLGVCNGFQWMTQMGWLPRRDIVETSQPRLTHNTAGRFKSAWVAGQIMPGNPAVMLKGMEGSVLGMWMAHGEGRMKFRDPTVMEEIRKLKLAPLAYAGPDGMPTEAYPFNPNGSPEGWAALCSLDGRHLGMMPHPERSFLRWQEAWTPYNFRRLKASPWLHMFQNAIKFVS